MAGLSKNRSPVRQAWQAIRHEIRVYMGPVVRRNASTREVGNDISKRVAFIGNIPIGDGRVLIRNGQRNHPAIWEYRTWDAPGGGVEPFSAENQLHPCPTTDPEPCELPPSQLFCEMRRIVSQSQFAHYIGKHHSTVCNYIRHRILTRRPDRKLDLHQADRELSEYFDRPRRFRDGLNAELMEWRVPTSCCAWSSCGCTAPSYWAN